MSINYLRFIFPAIVGAVLGIGYEGASWYMHDYYPVRHLKPQPEAFWVDPVSFNLFAKLNKFRHKNVKAYRHALVKTDSLFVLEHALKGGRAKPVIEDIIRAETLAEIALKNATKLQETVTEVDQSMEIEHLVKELENMLYIHVENIRQLCRDCPV